MKRKKRPAKAVSKKTAPKRKRPAQRASPTPAKLSARQENFVREYVSGKTAAEAYAVAYGVAGHTAESAGSRLLRNVEVSRKITALRQRADDGSVMTLLYRRRYLKRVVDTPIGDIDHRSDLCQERTVTTSEDGCTEKIKMPGKLGAIELDSKLAGDLRDKVEVEHGLDGLLEVLELIGAS